MAMGDLPAAQALLEEEAAAPTWGRLSSGGTEGTRSKGPDFYTSVLATLTAGDAEGAAAALAHDVAGNKTDIADALREIASAPFVREEAGDAQGVE